VQCLSEIFERAVKREIIEGEMALPDVPPEVLAKYLGILAGITRAVLQHDLAPGLGLKVLDGVFTAEDLAAADEAFLSSSTREIMPVAEVDGAPIATGDPGPTAAALQAALRALATSGS